VTAATCKDTSGSQGETSGSLRKISDRLEKREEEAAAHEQQEERATPPQPTRGEGRTTSTQQEETKNQGSRTLHQHKTNTPRRPHLKTTRENYSKEVAPKNQN
jgi:hypothetical protein